MEISSSKYIKLTKALKCAIKNQDQEEKDTLRMVIASCKNLRISKGIDLNDNDIIDVLLKEKKKRQQSIEQYEIGGRKDLVKKEEVEIQIIEKFLPQELSVKEIEDLIEEGILKFEAQTIKDMGKIINYIKTKKPGQVDLSLASQMVKSRLK